MRVAIAGAGNVGLFIANDLSSAGHEVQLIEQNPAVVDRSHTPDGVEWLVADACEVASLRMAGLERCDVVVAATGDDEDNLVISLLSKQEFGVPRVIARINNARNEWLFNEKWGVDISVSTPALITSLVDEAVEVGSIINLMDLAQGRMKLIEVTLAANAPAIVRKLSLDELRLPDSVRVVAVVRSDQPMVPSANMHFLEHDHVILVAREDATHECATAFIG